MIWFRFVFLLRPRAKLPLDDTLIVTRLFIFNTRSRQTPSIDNSSRLPHPSLLFLCVARTSPRPPRFFSAPPRRMLMTVLSEDPSPFPNSEIPKRTNIRSSNVKSPSTRNYSN